MERPRIRTPLVLAFPVVLSAGIVLIPVVSDYSDRAVAVEAVGSSGRWFVGHLLAAAAFAVSILSISVVATVLADRSQRLPSFAPRLIAVGAGLYAAGLRGEAPVRSPSHRPARRRRSSSMAADGG